MATKKELQLYRITAASLSPMLQNPMTPETLDELLGGKGARKKVQTDLTKVQRATAKLCIGPQGQFGFPSDWLFSCLIGAGREVQYENKSKISTATSSRLPAFLTILPDVVTEEGNGFVPFLDQDVAAKWIPDTRRGVLAANGVAVAIVRPKFVKWAFEITVEIDAALINVDKIKDLFDIAGRQCGLGDFRPQKKGVFGRFEIEKFEEAKAVPARKAA